MKIRIKKFAPLQTGKMLAAFYGLISLIVAPVLILVAIFAPGGNAIPLVLAIVFPLLYIIFGFIVGVIGAFLYNLVSRWIGGVEMVFEEEV